MKCYAKSPWNLVVLTQVQAQQTQLVLVVPVWKTQSWFPTLLHMLIDYPRLIIQKPDVVVSKDPMLLLPQLAIWNISGRSSKTKTFLKKLQHSCSNHGEQKQTNLMTYSLISGIAGVLNGVLFRFQDP